MIAQRANSLTLGVADVARARAYYDRPGWRASNASQESVTCFEGNGTVLALFGRQALAKDVGRLQREHAAADMPLACNVASKAEVDRIYHHTIACGATALKSPVDVFWGGYSGYFADPDGHVCEVAHNPFFVPDDQGHLILPSVSIN